MADDGSKNLTPISVGESSFLPGMASLSLLRQAGLLIAIAASVALGIAVALWSREPEMRPLGHYDREQIADVIGYLDQNKIRYRLTDEGMLLVAQDKFQKVQIALAAQGVSESGGDDYLKKDSGFGVSQRLERARLLRNQELQLAASIGQFAGVRAAQVHLAIPRQTSFVGTQKVPSAAVILSLTGRGRLSDGQALAIVDLISGAVSGLARNKVAVTDQFGRLYNSASAGSDEVASEREFHAEQTRQQELARKLETLLTPILGPGNFTVQVNVDMNFSHSEQTQKMFNPDPAAVTSERQMETTSRGGSSGGIPGALSNQPPAAATIPEQITKVVGSAVEKVANNSKSVGNRRTESERKFDIDTTISHTRQQVGTIVRQSVSIGVNFATPADDSATPIPRSQLEIDKIKRLVEGVIGYDVTRGDRIMIDSFNFVKPEAPLPVQPRAFYEQPLFRSLWKPVVSLLGLLLLLFGVLKPLMNKLVAPSPAHPGQRMPALAGGAAGEPMLLGSEEQNEMLAVPGQQELSQIKKAKKLVGDDPKMVAALVQNWIAVDE